jgi:long-chain fatty acid transport protein
MKKILFIVLSVSIGILLFVSHASAAGFALPEQGAAAMGMGSAFVGQADDASAVWYNPAGITQLDGIRVMGGGVVILPSFSHDNSNGNVDDASQNTHLPVIFYTTYKMTDKFAFGFGVNNPFGLATNWRSNSATREVALETKVRVTEYNPNVAYKITDKLSVAAGVTYVYMNATLTNWNATFSTVSRLEGSGSGWGGNFAALYKISDSLSTGISYRSRIKVDVDGTVQLVGVLSSLAKTAITLPDLMSWGFSAKPTDRLTLNLDLGYTWWSTYDKIKVSAQNSAFNNTYEKQWNDVWNVRVGGQYKVTDNWKLRMGYQYDRNPITEQYFETRVPDSDRHGFSIGTGYSIGNLTLDLAYLYLHFEKRNINGSDNDNTTSNANSLQGTYKAGVHCIGLSAAYKF